MSRQLMPLSRIILDLTLDADHAEEIIDLTLDDDEKLPNLEGPQNLFLDFVPPSPLHDFSRDHPTWFDDGSETEEEFSLDLKHTTIDEFKVDSEIIEMEEESISGWVEHLFRQGNFDYPVSPLPTNRKRKIQKLYVDNRLPHAPRKVHRRRFTMIPEDMMTNPPIAILFQDDDVQYH